jgi:predicted 2-oxoglutarate/Fe(II)-dependent dioxygenase YbiX/peroxiredoxin
LHCDAEWLDGGVTMQATGLAPHEDAATDRSPGPVFRSLLAGDHAPWFGERGEMGPDRVLHQLAGRYVVLCIVGSSGDPAAREAFAAIKANRHLFDGVSMALLGFSLDPRDGGEGGITQVKSAGIQFFVDRDLAVASLYGVVPQDAMAGSDPPRRPQWIVLDPTLRVMATFALGPLPGGAREVMAYLNSLQPPASFAGFPVQAPVLVLPTVFEPELCRRLVAYYEAEGGRETGVMRVVDGRTQVVSTSGKKRSDVTIGDPGLRRATHGRIARRVLPEILKAYQCPISRIQRFRIGCYAAEDGGGFFNQHRDNTTPLTAHRRFAVSVALNTDFEGGFLSFPEYGPRGYRIPLGGAVVFSCSLLHAVSRVTGGKRYVFLPFLFDEPAMAVYDKAHAGDPTAGSDITHVPDVPHPSGRIVYGEF